MINLQKKGFIGEVVVDKLINIERAVKMGGSARDQG
jgi:hypothetical protein